MGNAVRSGFGFLQQTSVAATVPPASVSDTVARLRLVPGLDVDAGLAFLGNSADVFVRLLTRFVGLHEADVHQLVGQAERADCASIQRLAHAIKGGAATLGLTGLAGLAQQLEQAACANESGTRMIELARALQSGHAALGRHLMQVAAERPAAPRT
jgi:two-component system sensor histidine kinase/response regulator